ncbi:MAG: hypothetical protein IPN77_09485 [Sandaracinaceae bacterium]|nr:hypothetical protein [Sandaracinaceae bacterium]
MLPLRSHAPRPRWGAFPLFAPWDLSLVALGALMVTWLVAGDANASFLDDVSESYRAALAEGRYGPALGMTYLAGLLTALTPCVYPDRHHGEHLRRPAERLALARRRPLQCLCSASRRC